MSENNNTLEKIVKADSLSFEANPAIEQRLMYHFQLKSAFSKIKKNHLFPFADLLFSPKFIGFKMAFAASLIVFAIGFNHFSSPKEIILQADTASVFNNSMDTLCFVPPGDSILVN